MAALGRSRLIPRMMRTLDWLWSGAEAGSMIIERCAASGTWVVRDRKEAEHGLSDPLDFAAGVLGP